LEEGITCRVRVMLPVALDADGFHYTLESL
jgi:hypothetical protein